MQAGISARGGMSAAEIEALLARVERARPISDPAADWLRANLANHLRRGRPFAPLPAALAEDLLLDPAVEPGGWGLEKLCEVAAEAVAARIERGVSDAARISVAAALGHADLAVRQRRNADRRSARRGLLHGGALDEPVVAWDRGERIRRVAVDFGSFGIRINFHQGREGSWTRGWGLSRDTEERFRANGAFLKGTGWFARIDAVLRSVTRTFLDEVRPDELVIIGADGKRNAHNAATYGSIHPEGYALVRLMEGPGGPAGDGTRGVRFERLPEPVAAPGR